MTDTNSTAPATSTPKPGYATTEGWLSFIIAILGAATGTHFVGDGSTAATYIGLATAALTAITYTWSRTQVKTA